jgi:hypothetical protein
MMRMAMAVPGLAALPAAGCGGAVQSVRPEVQSLLDQGWQQLKRP